MQNSWPRSWTRSSPRLGSFPRNALRFFMIVMIPASSYHAWCRPFLKDSHANYAARKSEACI